MFGDRVHLATPDELGLTLAVEAAGSSYTGNARARATTYFGAAGVPTIGEDSGLQIDMLGGTPGVHSARFEQLPDGAIKNAHILDMLDEVPPGRRICHYRCTIVFKPAADEEHIFHGICAGYVAEAPAGSGGFSFDPIVRLSGNGRTLAELSDEERAAVSHRGRAARKLLRFPQA